MASFKSLISSFKSLKHTFTAQILSDFYFILIMTFNIVSLFDLFYPFKFDNFILLLLAFMCFVLCEALCNSVLKCYINISTSQDCYYS